MTYIRHIGVALTQLLCAVCGGWPDESTSSYLYRLDLQGNRWGVLLRPVVDALFFWQRGHCRLSYEAERRRYQLPPLLRGCIHDVEVSQ